MSQVSQRSGKRRQKFQTRNYDKKILNEYFVNSHVSLDSACESNKKMLLIFIVS